SLYEFLAQVTGIGFHVRQLLDGTSITLSCTSPAWKRLYDIEQEAIVQWQI
ncbi:hypothetical protein H6F80_27745, partial [Leptolyngbya sp. FACHB-711]|nr:hypothetical protein [Leptolyngbya sp. FACHB-711]